MKKLSEIYKQLQLCALACDALSDEEKVVAIKELLEKESVAAYFEQKEIEECMKEAE